jgi:Protein of unknown function (DUF2807).
MKRLVLKKASSLICGMVFTSLLFLTSCVGIQGNGNIVSQERAASDFQGLTLSGVANINIHPGEAYKVEVTTDDNLQDFISVESKNGVLHIGTKDNENLRPTKLIVDVYLPELQSINLSGVGNVTLPNGNASNLKISLSGVGNIDAQNYQVQNITVQNSGVGNAKLWATDSLSGAISGVGNISYKGDPEVNIKVSGVGKVKKI